MAEYMAYRIIDGVFTFEQVVAKRPDLEEGIKKVLISVNRGDLIPGYAPPEPPKEDEGEQTA